MQSLYTSVPIAVALVLVQLVQTRSSSTQPASAHVTLIPVGSKLGEVQSAYTSMLLSTPDGGTGVPGAELGAPVLGAGALETVGLESAVLGAGVLAGGVVGAELPTWEPGVLDVQPARARMAVQTQPDSAKERREKVIMYLKTPQNSIWLAVPGHHLTSAVVRPRRGHGTRG